MKNGKLWKIPGMLDVFILYVFMFGFVFYYFLLYIFILHVYGPFCSVCCVQLITKSSGKKKIFIFGVFFFFLIKCEIHNV